MTQHQRSATGLAAGTRYRMAGPGVIMKDFGDELVVANLDTGLFYSLGGSAIALWAWLSEGRALAEIEAAYAGDAGAAAAIAAFVEQLEAEALLQPCDKETQPALFDPLPPRAFEPPVIERFDDLQGLLLVDPIHDVSDQGWPLRANGA